MVRCSEPERDDGPARERWRKGLVWPPSWNRGQDWGGLLSRNKKMVVCGLHGGGITGGIG